MKYSGRIISAILIMGLFFFWITYRTIQYGSYFQDMKKLPFMLVALVLYLCLGWFIGKQFDKSKYYAKKLEQREIELTVKYDELQESKQELYQIIDQADSILYIRDIKNKSMQVSSGIENLYGYSKENFLKDDTFWAEIILPEDLQIGIEMEKLLLSGVPHKCSFRIRTRDGQIRWLHTSANPIFDSSGDIVKIHGVGTDITELKDKQERIQHMAYHDSLTGLPKRVMVMEFLKHEIETCEQNDQKLAALYIDMDRFKKVNDMLGHQVGDQLLIEVAGKLKGSARLQDMVARQGGDEFILIMLDTNEDEISQLAQSILTNFSNPFIIQDEEVYITPSIGVSVYPDNGENGEELLKNADQAMSTVKERGKNNYQFFTSQSEDMIYRKVRLENGLRKAIDNNELFLQYQPQFDLSSGELLGMEALLRWDSQEFGMVSPYEFISIAEETGLIIPIGRWVIREACQQHIRWSNKNLSPPCISVNVSVKQLSEHQFVENIQKEMRQTGMQAEYLQIEITESIMQNYQESKKILDQLKSIGIQISMDDFGTGFSSLSVLKHLPIDYIKIDQSFIKDLSTNAGVASIVKSIIEMGHSLGFKLVAEGIEDKFQLEFLQHHRCNSGQGYFFNKPMSNQNMARLLSNNTRMNIVS